jgi:hypothetical protein
VTSAEKRLGGLQALAIEPIDFDQRPPGSAAQARGVAKHPTPIPDVASYIEQVIESGDPHVAQLAHEFKFVAGTLRYIQARLFAPASVEAALLHRQMKGSNDGSVGSFLKLNCGHNNSFAYEEKMKLRALIEEAATVATLNTGAAMQQV